MPPPSHPASQSCPSLRTASGTHLTAFVPPHFQQSSVPGNHVPIPYQNIPGGGGYLYQSAENSALFNQYNVGQDENNFDSSHHASNNSFEPLCNSYISTPPLPPPFDPGKDDSLTQLLIIPYGISSKNFGISTCFFFFFFFFLLGVSFF
jgi:hypothetical protein